MLAEVTPAYCQALWERVCNWGRWGLEDEHGTLNLITKDKVRRSAALVTEGVSLGLGNLWPVTPGPHNAWPAEHRMIRAGDDCHYPGVPGLAVALDYIGIQHHGIACSHIDALCHVFVKERMYNGRAATEVRSTGAEFNDVMPFASGVVTRGVLLDLCAALSVNHLDGHHRISVDDLEKAERMASIQVEPGDVLIVHKGRERRVALEGHTNPLATGMPGLHPECAEWLHQRGVAVLGSDYMNDPQPNWDCVDWPLPIHYLGICGMGMTLMHNLETQTLANHCAASGRYGFQITIAALKIPRATGSPLNPIALF